MTKTKAVMCLIFLVLMASLEPVATGQIFGCAVTDESYIMSTTDCGTVTWDLRAAGIQVQDNAEDFGEGIGFGACLGDYYDCSGAYQGVSILAGSYAFSHGDPDASGQVEVAWDLSDPYVYDAGCPGSSPYPQGTVQVIVPNTYKVTGLIVCE